MSASLPATIVTPNVPKQVSLINIPNVTAIKLTNGTPFDLTISGFGVQGSSIVPAGLEYMLYAHIKNAGYITILAINNAGVTGNGVVNIVVFDAGESIPPGVWPVSVPTQTVSANLASSNQLINTGNPPLTNVITIQPSDAAGTTWVADNSGNLTISSDNVGTLVQLLKLVAGATPSITIGAVTAATTVAGALTVTGADTFNGNATFNGTILGSPNSTLGIVTVGGGLTFNGGDLTINGHNFVGLNTFTAGMSLTSGDFALNTHNLNSVGSLNLGTGSLTRISDGTYTGSTTAHTVNHLNGGTPLQVLAQGGANTGSTSCGNGTYTSTTFSTIEGFAVACRFRAFG